MAAYSRVYDLRHLQADCQDLLRNPTLGNRVWATFINLLCGCFVERLLAARPPLMFCSSPAHIAYSATESGLVVSPNFPSRIPHTAGSPVTCDLKITACARCRIRLNFDGLQRSWLTRCDPLLHDRSSPVCRQG